MPSTENRTHPEHDALHYVAKIRGKLDDLISHLREDEAKVSQSKAQALFETSAEVLIGLRTAFEHYEKGTEAAMRESSTRAS
jgi:hypothetical protein